MSIRQYIGARYVTKIYENSLDPSSAEWEGGRAYEPLTLVTYLNSSYLSKKEVPASVGDPASNPTYWVITGAYNGQIMQLQNDVAQLQTEVSGIRDKMYIMGGDSYSIENYGHTGWIDLVNANLGLTRGVNSFDARDIVGYYGGSFAAGNFLAQIQALYTAVPDPDKITDICYFAGTNEVSYTSVQVGQGIADFMDYVRSHFPNALVTIGYIGGKRSTTSWSDFRRVADDYRKYAASNGARYCNNIEYVNMKYDDYYDELHPNDYNVIARYIAQGILAGSVEVKQAATKTVSGYGAFFIRQVNSDLELWITLNNSAVTDIAVSWNHGNTELVDFSIPYMPFIKDNITWFQPVTYKNPGSSDFNTCNMLFTLTTDGKLKASAMTYPDLTGIQTGATFSYPSELRYIAKLQL